MLCIRIALSSEGATPMEILSIQFNNDYRLVRPKNDEAATVRDCVVDCKDALRFLRQNAGALGLDLSRVVVFGESAGAHLALMAALTPPGAFCGKTSPGCQPGCSYGLCLVVRLHRHEGP